MSDGPNAEVFRRAVEAMNSGRWLDEVPALCTEDCEFSPLRVAMTGVFHGHDGLRAFWHDTQETFDKFHVDYDRIEQQPDGRVLATGVFVIRGRGSSAEGRQESAVVAAFRDGKISEVRDYGDAAEARAALGLSD